MADNSGINNNKRDFDDFPIYDELTKPNSDKISNVWQSFLASFKETLSGYLTSGGIFLPNLTQDQIDKLQSPQLGQMIFNVTTQTGQIYQGSPTPAWVDFS